MCDSKSTPPSSPTDMALIELLLLGDCWDMNEVKVLKCTI